MGNQLSGIAEPRRSAETDIYEGPLNKFTADYIPPSESKLRPILDSDPMFRPSPSTSGSLSSGGEKRMADELESKARVESMDCVRDTVGFMAYPALLGALYGSTQAASVTQRSLSAAAALSSTSSSLNTSNSGLAGATKSLLSELKFVWRPMGLMAAYSGIYSALSCSLAKVSSDSGDGVWNSAIAGSITGSSIAMIQFKCPNRMIIFGFWAGLLAGVAKYELLSGTLERPQRTYYELMEHRKGSVRFLDADGYRHDYLEGGLRAVGLRVPESWATSTK